MPPPREAEAYRKAKQELQIVRVHATMKRGKTSQTIKDLVEYCNVHMRSDPLIFPEKTNPFKPQKSCTIL